MSSKGLRVDYSTVEMALLAEARCHHVIKQVVAFGHEKPGDRLKGHSIVFRNLRKV